MPPAGVLRRERRALLQFREELVRERCEELLELDEHLAAIDTLLGISWALPEPARCACGAPVGAEARFCPSCGRSLVDSGPAPLVVSEPEPPRIERSAEAAEG